MLDWRARLCGTAVYGLSMAVGCDGGVAVEIPELTVKRSIRLEISICLFHCQ